MRRLVLDANAFRGLREGELESLARRGFVLRVSRTAFAEVWVRSVLDYRAGTDRRKARGIIFSRARLLARYVDQGYPVALIGGHLVERVCQQMQGSLDMQSDSARAAAALRFGWSLAASGNCSDEDWLAVADTYLPQIESLDMLLKTWAVTEDALSAMLTGPGQEERTRAWASMTAAQRLDARMFGARRQFLIRGGELLAERFDALSRVIARRAQLAGTGAEQPRRTNDGPDLQVLGHLAEGFGILTEDVRMRDLVRDSGTFQAAWVRSMEEVDEMPDVVPWGDSAREIDAQWRRRAGDQRAEKL